jgi:hypothetical protein
MRNLMRHLITALVALLGLGDASQLHAAPNIVLILVDDMDYPERQLVSPA